MTASSEDANVRADDDRWAELRAYLRMPGFTRDGRSYYEWLAGKPPIRLAKPLRP